MYSLSLSGLHRRAVGFVIGAVLIGLLSSVADVSSAPQDRAPVRKPAEPVSGVTASCPPLYVFAFVKELQFNKNVNPPVYELRFEVVGPFFPADAEVVLRSTGTSGLRVGDLFWPTHTIEAAGVFKNAACS